MTTFLRITCAIALALATTTAHAQDNSYRATMLTPQGVDFCSGTEGFDDCFKVTPVTKKQSRRHCSDQLMVDIVNEEYTEGPHFKPFSQQGIATVADLYSAIKSALTDDPLWPTFFTCAEGVGPRGEDLGLICLAWDEAKNDFYYFCARAWRSSTVG